MLRNRRGTRQRGLLAATTPLPFPLFRREIHLLDKAGTCLVDFTVFAVCFHVACPPRKSSTALLCPSIPFQLLSMPSMLWANLFLVFLGSSAVLGQAYTETLMNSTTSTVVCNTYYTSISPTVSLETYYTSSTISPRAVVYTSTTTNTITKPATTKSTVTRTLTVTVRASHLTGTTTITKTQTLQITDTTTTTLVSTETDQTVAGTIVTVTALVPTPDGFEYINDTIGPNIYYKRDGLVDRAAAVKVNKFLLEAIQYPISVVCKFFCV